LKNAFSLLTKTVCLFVFLSSPLMAQKSGQSIQIQYGVVVASKYIQEKSNAGKGALVGGAVTSAAQGSREAREYQVRTATGVTVIISDQTQIAVDDCVIIETPNKGNANIRRVVSTYCDPASADVVAELQDEMLEEAQECVAAKRELSAASTDEAVDRALRKSSILCDM
jgi:hypothetical protein